MESTGIGREAGRARRSFNLGGGATAGECRVREYFDDRGTPCVRRRIASVDRIIKDRRLNPRPAWDYATRRWGGGGGLSTVPKETCQSRAFSLFRGGVDKSHIVQRLYRLAEPTVRQGAALSGGKGYRTLGQQGRPMPYIYPLFESTI